MMPDCIVFAWLWKAQIFPADLRVIKGFDPNHTGAKTDVINQRDGPRKDQRIERPQNTHAPASSAI